MRTANYPTSESMPTANYLAVNGIYTWGGGNSLIINDKEVSRYKVSPRAKEVSRYKVSPRAVSTTDTARGLFAFRRFRVARKSCCQKSRVSESLRSCVAEKMVLLSHSEGVVFKRIMLLSHSERVVFKIQSF